MLNGFERSRHFGNLEMFLLERHADTVDEENKHAEHMCSGPGGFACVRGHVPTPTSPLFIENSAFAH